ncbi:MAG: peptide/nickel transport system substrate-binding protein [Chloroflexota bacterium]|nr:peptide/nickel transport system substrate-binding protein [Chloroflexota bacterium]
MKPGIHAGLLLAVLLAGCAAPVPSSSAPAAGGADGAQKPAASAPPSSRTVVVATDTQIDGFGPMFFGGKSGPEELAAMLHRGLADIDDKGVFFPSAAVALPSLDDGTWRVFDDGHADTTWRLRPNARWHDGSPLTAEDVVFSWQVAITPDVPYKEWTAAKLIQSIDVVDPQTTIIHWSSFFLAAGRLGGNDLFLLPRHLLEPTFLGDHTAFVNSTFWSSAFVGVGPYRLTGWEPGSSADIEAFDGFYGQAPQIRTITFRIIPDISTAMANILAGQVDSFMGSSLGVSEAEFLKTNWESKGGGQVITAPRLIFEIRFAPGDPKVADLRMRKALMYGVDREAIVRDLYGGLVQVAHSYVIPGTSGFDMIDAQTTKYPYDPARSRQLLGELGIQPGADGMLRDARGEMVTLPFSTTTGNQERESAQATIGSMWKALGFDVVFQNVPLTVSQSPDYKYSTTDLSGLGADFENNMFRIDSRNLRTPQNPRGANQFGYTNPEVDRLLDQWGRTPVRARQVEIEAQVIHRLSEDLPFLPVNYRIEALTASKGLLGLPTRTGAAGATNTWNVESWQLTQ